MKKILLLLSIVSGVVIIACDKGTTLPVSATSTIFKVTSSMTDSKDTIRPSGDTVIYSVQGNISDTSRTYGISANVQANDTTNQANLIAADYTKSITVKFDTSGLGKSGLYHWTSSVKLYFPPVAAKTGIKTIANFTFGLVLSSETGNELATDSRTIHVQSN